MLDGKSWVKFWSQQNISGASQQKQLCRIFLSNWNRWGQYSRGTQLFIFGFLWPFWVVFSCLMCWGWEGFSPSGCCGLSHTHLQRVGTQHKCRKALVFSFTATRWFLPVTKWHMVNISRVLFPLNYSRPITSLRHLCSPLHPRDASLRHPPLPLCAISPYRKWSLSYKPKLVLSFSRIHLLCKMNSFF